MSLVLSMTITREEYQESPLEINDGPYLIAANGLQPGDISYRREQVTSPYVHGDFTTHRALESPNAQIIVNTTADHHGELQQHVHELIRAFIQDEFVITLEMNNSIWKWRGEAADYAVGFSQPRQHALNVPVGFRFPRYPLPLDGPF